MKFVLRILIYLVATLVNFAAYVFLFVTVAGLSPQQSLDIMKTKMQQVAVDTAKVETGMPATGQMRSDINKARHSVSEEMGQLEKEKADLLSEKTELERLRDEIQRLLARKGKAEEERMYKLAKIYDGMDQEKLADIFSQMEDTLIIGVLPKMKPNNASLVLEYLPPQRSARISKILLEGN